jgi:2-polyprenyl-3-methyl-5-hydroxy-6-metoxy-1,4-benzoquinol methylase
MPGLRKKNLDVGCAGGRDFLSLVRDNGRFDLYGIDNRDLAKVADGWKFHQQDASDMDFQDGEFDVVVSIGVLEHIKPIIALDAVTREIARVGKKYIVIVPCNGTWLEAHRVQFNWQKKSPAKNG